MTSFTLEWPEPDVNEVWTQAFGRSKSQDVRSLAKYLCEAHSQKKIGDETFTLLLEFLLSFYIENRFEKRMLKKSGEFDRRLSKYLMGSMLFE